jgi:hypothetical protein
MYTSSYFYSYPAPPPARYKQIPVYTRIAYETHVHPPCQSRVNGFTAISTVRDQLRLRTAACYRVQRSCALFSMGGIVHCLGLQAQVVKNANDANDQGEAKWKFAWAFEGTMEQGKMSG